MADARTLIVPHADVERLLPMPSCIDVMADALAATTRGDALLPLRQVLRLHSGRDAFAVMPAVLGNAIGAKVITVFPGNDATPYESHMGVILYFDDTHGRLLAIIDAYRAIGCTASKETVRKKWSQIRRQVAEKMGRVDPIPTLDAIEDAIIGGKTTAVAIARELGTSAEVIYRQLQASRRFSRYNHHHWEIR